MQWQTLAKLFGGIVVGRVGSKVLQALIDPGPPADGTTSVGLVGGGGSRFDDIATLGGAGLSAWQAKKGGKWSMFFAGIALGMATPILDGLVDMISAQITGAAQAA